jgi:hypothetical protein
MAAGAGRSGYRIEHLFVVTLVQQGLADDLAGQDAALAALAGNAQAIAHIAQRMRAIFYRSADLGVSNAFTNAYVHNGGSFIVDNSPKVNANENDCQ